MVTVFIYFAAIIICSISLIHIYWAFGGQWATHAVVPEQEGKKAFTPSRGGTLFVALLLSMAAMLLLLKAGLIQLSIPAWIISSGAWVCAVVFAMRVIGEFNYFGVFKKRRETAFSKLDTRVYIPLCALLSMAFLIAIRAGG